MVIYIQIHRLEEFDEAILYEFGPSEGTIGQVLSWKATGEVTLFQIDPNLGSELFYLPRVRRVLHRHFEYGEFPDRTCYACQSSRLGDFG